MSLHSDARVTTFLADYASVDSSGKVNALGAGFLITGVTDHGFTSPQYVAVLIDLPQRHAGEDFAVGVELRDTATGGLVMMPPGPGGTQEPLRVQQVMRAEQPQIPGAYIPNTLLCRAQTILGFPQGLLVTPGRSYRWVVSIDGQTRAGWEANFHVLGPPPAPVIGGPGDVSMPTDLPPFPTDPEEPPASAT